MLKIEKDEIYEYVEKHNLEYIHDHSNDDEQFDRNFIRSRLIPLISERWPAAIKKISDLSELSQQDIEFKNIFWSKGSKSLDQNQVLIYQAYLNFLKSNALT